MLVGYGDVMTRTNLGRLVQVTAVVFAIFITAVLSSVITSSVVVTSQTAASITTFADLTGPLCVETGYEVRPPDCHPPS